MSEKKKHEFLQAWQAEREVIERKNDLMNTLQHVQTTQQRMEIDAEW